MAGWFVACPRDGPTFLLTTNWQLGLGKKDVELMIDHQCGLCFCWAEENLNY
jgi:hypothetical protein